MKKIAITITSLLLILAVGGIFFAKEINVELTEEMVQRAIDSKIDEGTVNSRGVDIKLNAAKVDFRANNTASVNVDFEANGYGYAGSMHGDCSTGLRYKAPKIYLADLSATDMQTRFDDKTAGEIEDVKNVAKDFFKCKREEMLTEDAQESLDNIVGRNQEKLEELAVKATHVFFETIPIYDLNSAGLKGSLASLALKEVKFTEDSAVVTLSPSQAIFKILSVILGALLFALIFIMPYVRWGRKV